MPVTIYECPLAACPWEGTDPPPPPGEAITSDADVWRFIGDRAMAAEEVVRAHLETHSLLEWVQELARLRNGINGWSRHLLHASQHNNMQIALGGRIQRVADEMREAVGLPAFGWNDAVPDAEFGECSVRASGCRGQEAHP